MRFIIQWIVVVSIVSLELNMYTVFTQKNYYIHMESAIATTWVTSNANVIE